MTPRPKTHRLAGWLAVALGGIYVLLTPMWAAWAVTWEGFGGFFWPLEITAIAAVVTGVVLLVRANRSDVAWREMQMAALFRREK